MERYGVVDLGPDAAFLEELLQRISLTRTDNELVVDVPAVRGLWRQHHAPGPSQLSRRHLRRQRQPSLREELTVQLCVALLASRPAIKVLELDAQHGGLQRVQPEVPAHYLV